MIKSAVNLKNMPLAVSMLKYILNDMDEENSTFNLKISYEVLEILLRPLISGPQEVNIGVTQQILLQLLERKHRLPPRYVHEFFVYSIQTKTPEDLMELVLTFHKKRRFKTEYIHVYLLAFNYCLEKKLVLEGVRYFELLGIGKCMSIDLLHPSMVISRINSSLSGLDMCTQTFVKNRSELILRRRIIHNCLIILNTTISRWDTVIARISSRPEISSVFSSTYRLIFSRIINDHQLIMRFSSIPSLSNLNKIHSANYFLTSGDEFGCRIMINSINLRLEEPEVTNILSTISLLMRRLPNESFSQELDVLQKLALYLYHGNPAQKENPANLQYILNILTLRKKTGSVNHLLELINSNPTPENFLSLIWTLAIHDADRVLHIYEEIKNTNLFTPELLSFVIVAHVRQQRHVEGWNIYQEWKNKIKITYFTYRVLFHLCNLGNLINEAEELYVDMLNEPDLPTTIIGFDTDTDTINNTLDDLEQLPNFNNILDIVKNPLNNRVGLTKKQKEVLQRYGIQSRMKINSKAGNIQVVKKLFKEYKQFGIPEIQMYDLMLKSITDGESTDYNDAIEVWNEYKEHYPDDSPQNEIQE
eukprot:TRINITY_DN7478_c0_g1_i2.p1 TRINITY_DN7478_c0_g1~~TRINITY_DN7478_c0_g1_i2.p1  ORF type:complete len:589 (+),score=72.88 TRINITY_DN7478_c0_g1_i2:242-2008(+)